MDGAPWDEGMEPGDGKPRIGSAVGCFVCASVFITGLVLLALEITRSIATGTLPDEAHFSEDLFALGAILLVGGFAGRFGARWALARGDWPGRLIPTLKRVSWTVGLVGVGVMGIAAIWGLIVILFLEH
ncbi:MAG TPA: hypothetical protein VMX57_01320 [Planctomycetota bacterium]|nr:hypothetical protein [Planctomycetota bacterium]